MGDKSPMEDLFDVVARRILEMEASPRNVGEILWRLGFEKRPEENESCCSHDQF